MVYPNFKDQSLFKDLPSVFIGRVEIEHLTEPTTVNKEAEGASDFTETGGDDLDEEESELGLDGEKIMFCGMGRVVVSTIDEGHDPGGKKSHANEEDSARRSTIDEHANKTESCFDEDPNERTVGSRVWDADMEHVVFTPHSTFVTDEIAVVPRYEGVVLYLTDQTIDPHNRSAGGFTYGKVLCAWNCNCPLGEGHKHPGWRVIIDERQTPRVVKHLLSVNIGKLHVAGVRPDVISTSPPGSNKPITPGPVKVPPISDGLRFSLSYTIYLLTFLKWCIIFQRKMSLCWMQPMISRMSVRMTRNRSKAKRCRTRSNQPPSLPSNLSIHLRVSFLQQAVRLHQIIATKTPVVAGVDYSR